MFSKANTLQNITSVDDFLNVAAIETAPLFEYLSFEFLLEYDVFAPCKRGRTQVHEPPELFRVFLHCYYEDVYGTRPVARELQKTLVWLGCGFDRQPSRDAVDRFLTDLEHVVDDAFDHLVEQVAIRGLFDSTYRIDRLTSKRFRGTTTPRGTTIQPPKSTTTLRLYDRLDRSKDSHRSGVHTSKASARGDGDARHA